LEKATEALVSQDLFAELMLMDLSR
jgi:hypothetical protein